MKTKKFVRKLTLSKSTISNLNSQEQGKVKGGYITATCPGFPEYCDSETPRCTIGCPSINPLYCETEWPRCP
jgi:hypothetical protein